MKESETDGLVYLEQYDISHNTLWKIPNIDVLNIFYDYHTYKILQVGVKDYLFITNLEKNFVISAPGSRGSECELSRNFR